MVDQMVLNPLTENELNLEYVQLLQLTKKKSENTIFEKGKKRKGNIEVVNMHMKRLWISLVYKEIQIKSTPIRMAKNWKD